MSYLTFDTSSLDDISGQVDETLKVLEHHLGTSICAIHLFGSAVDGGLKPLSDIDLLVTINAPLTESTKAAVMSTLLSVSAYPGADAVYRALEVTVLFYDDVVPWKYPAMRQMQFGEWLREEISAGVFEPAMVDNDLAILLTKVRQHSIALYGPAAQDFFDEVPVIDLHNSLLETLKLWTTEADWKGDERNIILALVRIWYTAVTGDIASKEAAANWALHRLPSQHHNIVAAARDEYLGRIAIDVAAYPQERAELLDYIRASVTRKLVSSSQAKLLV